MEASLSWRDAAADISSGMMGALCARRWGDRLSALAGLPACEPASGHCFNQQSNTAEEGFCQPKSVIATPVCGFHLDTATASVTL